MSETPTRDKPIENTPNKAELIKRIHLSDIKCEKQKCTVLEGETNE